MVEKIVGGDWDCVPVGSFSEQFGPSRNNSFILVRIPDGEYSEGLRQNAITVRQLHLNLQNPRAGKEST